MPLRISKSGSTIATFKILNFDSDAQTFLTAAGITDSTQQNAINKLTIDLKYYGLWTKMKALYPVVGGTATSHKWNLKDPRDLDAAFRLTFTAGWTHSSTGMTPTNAYANTFVTPSTALSLNSTHISYYSRTNTQSTGLDFGASSYVPGDNKLYGFIRYTDDRVYVRVNRATGTESNLINSDSRKFFIVNRNSATVEDIFIHNVKTSFSYNSSGLPTNSIYIGTANLAGGSLLYSNKQCAFASIGDGLTDQDAINFYNIVQQYQINLGRQV
jgi:hypothetical protein